MRVYQIRLPSSGKAIRFRELSGDEGMEVSLRAAKLIPADGTPLHFRMMELNEGAKMMLVAVTKSPTDGKASLADDSLWEKLDPDKLADGVDAFFGNAKDADVVRKVYQRYNEVRSDELDDVLGKAVEVAAD
jgi:hypothetical protein